MLRLRAVSLRERHFLHYCDSSVPQKIKTMYDWGNFLFLFSCAAFVPHTSVSLSQALSPALGLCLPGKEGLRALNTLILISLQTSDLHIAPPTPALRGKYLPVVLQGFCQTETRKQRLKKPKQARGHQVDLISGWLLCARSTELGLNQRAPLGNWRYWLWRELVV